MKPSLRKALVAGGAVLAIVVLVPVVTLLWTFRGLEPVVNGAELPGGARLLRAGVSNVYLLPTGSGVALVDCGNERDAATIRAELSRRGLTDDAVEAIFLTHGHLDHLTGCGAFPKAKVLALSDEAPIVEGDAVSRGIMPRLRGSAKPLAVRVTDRLRDGETVTVGTLSLRVFQVRGHTDGSAIFLANGVLYAGDSAFVEEGGSVRGAAYIFSDDPDESWREVRALADKLAAEGTEVRAVVTGHSGPLVGEGALAKLRE